MNEHVNLYYRQDGSDKVYEAVLVEQNNGQWRVKFSYGRRGNALVSGEKTSSAVDYPTAKKIYDKLVSEKKAKGYTEDTTGTPFTGEVVSSVDTGNYPQLLNPIEEDELEKYLTDDDWCVQEKFDGERRMVDVGATVSASNRKGLLVSIDRDLALATQSLPTIFLDGEIFSNRYVVFDAPRLKGGYRNRYKELQRILYSVNAPAYFHIPFTAWIEKDKRFLLDKLRKENAEGIVFKRRDALYIPGRPASGGNQLKFKFYETCSCFVHSHNLQRSVGISGFDQDNKMKRTEIGNVTIPPNKDVPNIGSIVEIKYLYWYKGGSLYQPQYLGLRDDLDLSDCLLSKLKIKRDE